MAGSIPAQLTTKDSLSKATVFSIQAARQVARGHSHPGTQVTAPCHGMLIFSPPPINSSPISCIQHAFRKAGALQRTGDRKLGENQTSLRSPGAGYPRPKAASNSAPADHTL